MSKRQGQAIPAGYSCDVSRTFDMRLVKEIMVKKEIWERIKEDGLNKEDYEPDENDGWLIFKVENKIAGICQMEVENSVTVNIHPALLKEYRPFYGRLAVKLFLKWMSACSFRKIQKVIATIPTCYPIVKNCALRLGFKVEGINRKSILKDGKLHDQWNLGMTRNEMEAI